MQNPEPNRTVCFRKARCASGPERAHDTISHAKSHWCVTLLASSETSSQIQQTRFQLFHELHVVSLPEHCSNSLCKKSCLYNGKRTAQAQDDVNLVSKPSLNPIVDTNNTQMFHAQHLLTVSPTGWLRPPTRRVTLALRNPRRSRLLAILNYQFRFDQKAHTFSANKNQTTASNTTHKTPDRCLS